MTDSNLAQIMSIKDWRHPYTLRNGESVEMAKPWFPAWNQWRLDTVTSQQQAILDDGFAGASALDIACNDGFYGFDLLNRGVANLVGLEARPDALDRAKLIKEHFNHENASFLQANIQTYDLKSLPHAPFDIVMFYGILYHLSNPVETLKAISGITKQLLTIQTFVTGDSDAVLRFWTEDLALPGAGMQTVALDPSQAAVAWMLEYAGFDLVLRVCPPYFSAKNWGPHTPQRHFAFFHAIKGNEDELERIRRDLNVKTTYEPESETLQVIEIDRSTPPLIPNFKSLVESS